jgi:hypothetical protein
MIKRKARRELGATDIGDLMFTLPPVTQDTYLKINADNTVSGLSLNEMSTEMVGGADLAPALAGVMGDITPAIGGVYDIGASGYEWYDGYFYNSVKIADGAITGDQGDLIVTSDSFTVGDITIVDNVLTPLTAPLYGYREVIVDGGLTVASTDPAYLRLTQLPATENLLTVIGNSETDSGGIYRGGFDVGGDGSQGYTVEKNVFVGFSSPTNYELRIYASSVGWGGPSYLQQLASQLVVGEIVTITVTTYNYGFYGTRILEYLGSDLGHYGTTRLRFADTAGMSTSDSYHNFQLEAIRPVENYDVLDTFTGSEGMLRFHPLTKTFEGHNGTAWAPLGGGDITVTPFTATIFAGPPNPGDGNIYSCISGTGSLGHSNIFLGMCAGSVTGTGKGNNFLGYAAGFCATGCYNNHLGSGTGPFSTGMGNNFFGQTAGVSNTSGSHNNFFGEAAGFCNTTGTSNNFLGKQAGCSNTTGCYNNFFGRLAGCSNTTGSNNNFFGMCTGLCNTTGSNNNFLGYFTGYCNTAGSYNVFLGPLAGFNNTTGTNNIGFGYQAGGSNTTGAHNVLIGANAGTQISVGTDNIILGSYAFGGSGYSAASCNIAIGKCTASYSCSNNIAIGYCAGGPVTGKGDLSFCDGSNLNNYIIMGNCLHSCALIQVGWTTVSDIRDKCILGTVPHGRGFLEKITPITYQFKNRHTCEITDTKKRYGFSAQEVLSAEGEDPVIVSATNSDKLFMDKDDILPVLVNAIKELSEENKTLKEKISALETRLNNAGI